MIRRLALAGVIALAGCSQTNLKEILEAAAKDDHPACLEVTITVPVGTEHAKLDRICGCEPDKVPSCSAPLAIQTH